MSEPSRLRVGVLTVSDRAASGEYEDRGGPAVVRWLEGALASDWEAVTRLVPDERQEIERALIELCDEERCHLVLSTGGTGPAPRDVTPEATTAVCERLLPGLPERMRAASAPAVPTAILSRQAAGVRGRALIVNLPGTPSAVAECLDAVRQAMPHCIRLLGGPEMALREGGFEPPHGGPDR